MKVKKMKYEYNDAVEYILSIPRFTKKNPLENTEHFLDILNCRDNDFKIIHVAGTNGKGSVCAFISNVLVTSGRKTGLFTSPHLVNINERIRIDNKEISNEDFLKAFMIAYEASIKMQKEGFEHPTFFEFMTGMALIAFKQAGVSYAIMEVGLGGRLDATNAIRNPIISVITSINLDHTELLGDTIEQIAFEKAGIIKKNVPLVYYGQDNRVDKVIRSVRQDNPGFALNVTDSKINVIENSHKNIVFSFTSNNDNCIILEVPFIAEYQAINASIAVSAIKVICQNDISDDIIKKAIATTVWEGRMEQVLSGIYLDGAHNDSGIDEFIKTVNSLETKGHTYILFSAVIEKDYDTMIRKIACNLSVDGIILAEMNNGRAIPISTLKEEFEKYTSTKIYAYKSVNEAFEYARTIKKDEDRLFCVGSLYLVGELKNILL